MPKLRCVRPGCRFAMSERALERVTTVAVKAKTIVLGREMRGDKVFRLIVASCIAQITANAQGVVQRDGESLHQMRVGLRRLQAALRLFSGIFAAPELTILRMRVKAFARDLSSARNLDVLIEQTMEPMALAIGNSACERLRRQAGPMRQDAWNRAVAAVKSDVLPLLLADLVAVADRRHKRSLRVIPAKRLAKAALNDFLKSVRRRGRGFSSLTPDERHRLRIALKHMRYAAEVFAALYRKKKKVRRYIETLRCLQDGLGEMNDLATAMHYWGHHSKAMVRRIEAVQRIRHDALHAEMHRVWTSFKKQRPFWT